VKEEDVHGQNQVKSSAVRAIRNSLTQTFPGIEGKLDEILPKKQPILIYKWFAWLQISLLTILVSAKITLT
jgi:hypothetical protein